MSRSAAAATDVPSLVEEPWSVTTAAHTRATPDRPELEVGWQPVVIAAAWWLLIVLAIIQSLHE